MMLKLSNWKILYKLLLLVCAMAVIIAIVAATGITHLRGTTAATHEIAGDGKLALIAARMNQNVLYLNRAEFRLVANPTPETLQQVTDVIEQHKKLLHERLELSKQSADTEEIAKLSAIEAKVATYLQGLQGTLTLVKELDGQLSLSDGQKKLFANAIESRKAAEATIAEIKSYADFESAKTDSSAEAASTNGARAETIMIGISALGVIGGIAFGYLLALFGIARPISASVANLTELSQGNKNVDIYGVDRKDEIGEIAGTMQVFKENLIEGDRLRAEQEATKLRNEGERRQSMLDLAARFESSVGSVVEGVQSAASELQSTAKSMTATAEETSRQSTAVASASEETTQNVQTVASATEELTASIQEIGGQVNESSRIVGEAVAQADDTNAKVQSLSEAAQKIGDVVRLINDIAGQTNLLALNATIEAARAGDAGKGFAVVASEVKILATQTAQATEEIASQVRSIQDATSRSAQAIQAITGTINRVNEISTSIAGAIQEQGAATQEISRNIQQAAQGTTEVSANISSVTMAAEQTGTAANDVLTAATELGKNGAVLKTEVDQFLRSLRA
jgi:methyl-accepting chemotaxis protein